MSINDTVKSIHRLAVLRDVPSDGYRLSIVLTPHAPGHPSTVEAADEAPTWCAQTYRGKGQWGNIAAFGVTPEAALGDLHSQLLNAHLKVDERREQVLKVAQGLKP